METTVKIKWDKPEEQDWLCDENIQIALRAYCTNTKFEVTDLKEMTGSEAIYGLCAWLTTKKEAAPIAELVKEFCETNKLIDPRDNWTDYLTYPKN